MLSGRKAFGFGGGMDASFRSVGPPHATATVRAARARRITGLLERWKRTGVPVPPARRARRRRAASCSSSTWSRTAARPPAVHSGARSTQEGARASERPPRAPGGPLRSPGRARQRSNSRKVHLFHVHPAGWLPLGCRRAAVTQVTQEPCFGKLPPARARYGGVVLRRPRPSLPS